MSFKYSVETDSCCLYLNCWPIKFNSVSCLKSGVGHGRKAPPGEERMMIKIISVLLMGIIASTRAEGTLSDMPENLKASVEWVWKNRISQKSSSAPLGEGSTVRKNLIFDQIYFENGKLLYCGRWQSTQKLTLENRKKLEQTVSTKINNWAKLLRGYDHWPYGEIPVKIVGWAVLDASVVVDKQPDEIIYTIVEHDPVSDQDSRVPANVPIAPNACSRFEHFSDARYTYESCPGGAANRFDMYLWSTTNWSGAVGGDWGQRMSEGSWLSGSMMIDHEMGHGFGITDFYEANQRPDDMNNGKIKSIMWAGNSSIITEWDKWMLRYIWTQLKNDTKRFPERQAVSLVSDRNGNTAGVRYKAGIVGHKVVVESVAAGYGHQPVAVQVFTFTGRVAASTVFPGATMVTMDIPANGFCIIKITGGGVTEYHKVNMAGATAQNR